MRGSANDSSQIGLGNSIKKQKKRGKKTRDKSTNRSKSRKRVKSMISDWDDIVYPKESNLDQSKAFTSMMNTEQRKIFKKKHSN